MPKEESSQLGNRLGDSLLEVATKRTNWVDSVAWNATPSQNTRPLKNLIGWKLVLGLKLLNLSTGQNNILRMNSITTYRVTTKNPPLKHWK